MARKQLGVAPSDPHDVATKAYADLKYTLPQNGIPGTDVANQTLNVSKLSATGAASPVTYLRGDNTWSPLVGNSILVTPSTNYTLEPPVRPLDGELVLFEICPTVQVIVTIPPSVLLTSGISNQMIVPANKSGFIGIRYSTTRSAWHVIATTLEA